MVEVGSVNSSNHTGSIVNVGSASVHTKYNCCDATVSTTHSYTVDSGDQYTAATCTAKRKNYLRCDCGYNPKSTSHLVEVGSVNSSNHTGTESVLSNNTDSAKHSVYSCCGANYSTTHTYNQNSGVQYSAATCTAKQKNYKSCACGYNPKSTSHLVEVGSVNSSNHTGSIVNATTSSACKKYNCCGAVTDTSHAYSYDCDTTCNDCGYVRSASHKSVNAATSSVCKKCEYCGTSLDTSHAYSYTCDTTCNDCGYVRSASHKSVNAATSSVCKKCEYCGTSLDTSHAYSYTCDTTCNDCGYVRSASHKSVNAATSSVCKKCEYCGTSLDTSHSMANTGTSSVHQTCSDCGYYTTSHSYTVDSGVQYKAATCTAARQNYKRCSCGYNPKSASYVVSTGGVNSSNHTGSVVNGGTSSVHTKYNCCGATVSTAHVYSAVGSASVCKRCTCGYEIGHSTTSETLNNCTRTYCRVCGYITSSTFVKPSTSGSSDNWGGEIGKPTTAPTQPTKAQFQQGVLYNWGASGEFDGGAGWTMDFTGSDNMRIIDRDYINQSALSEISKSPTMCKAERFVALTGGWGMWKMFTNYHPQAGDVFYITFNYYNPGAGFDTQLVAAHSSGVAYSTGEGLTSNIFRDETGCVTKTVKWTVEHGMTGSCDADGDGVWQQEQVDCLRSYGGGSGTVYVSSIYVVLEDNSYGTSSAPGPTFDQLKSGYTWDTSKLSFSGGYNGTIVSYSQMTSAAQNAFSSGYSSSQFLSFPNQEQPQKGSTFNNVSDPIYFTPGYKYKITVTYYSLSTVPNGCIIAHDDTQNNHAITLYNLFAVGGVHTQSFIWDVGEFEALQKQLVFWENHGAYVSSIRFELLSDSCGTGIVYHNDHK